MKDETKNEAARLANSVGKHLETLTKGGVDAAALFAAMLYNVTVVAKMCGMTKDDFMHDCEQGFNRIDKRGKIERIHD